VLIAEARICVEHGELRQAEDLFVRAKKQHLAVQTYIDSGRWQDAIRIAQEVEKGVKAGTISVPPADAEAVRSLYRTTLQNYGQFLRTSGSLERASVRELSEIARVFEESGDPELAIEASLMASPNSASGRMGGGMGGDFDRDSEVTAEELESIWMNAYRIATRASGVNVQEVASQVSQKLMAIKRYEAAATVLKECGLVYKAIQVCMGGQLWDKAMQLARGTDHEQIVNDEFVEEMKRQNRVSLLLLHSLFHSPSARLVLFLFPLCPSPRHTTCCSTATRPPRSPSTCSRATGKRSSAPPSARAPRPRASTPRSTPRSSPTLAA
jgi:hypothetical protein